MVALLAACAWLLDERTRAMGLPGAASRNDEYQAMVRRRREYRIGRALFFSSPTLFLLIAPGENGALLRTIPIIYMAICGLAYLALFLWSAEKSGVWRLERRYLKEATRHRDRHKD